ncbi:olfactory receptor 14A16-like [Sceloporus undulatus]|uniref:olfactory receptor 14A16-like n=1 Tax=Sceloporus undulatus TaxID=8520 RepID=UPI001C4C73CD|nr:olfactory receptor 14A16-like [Sceloporus undulatus]
MKDNMSNLTFISTFLLLEFSNIRELQIVHFFVFLALYLMGITGNLLIILAVTLDHRLHTPMFFFVLNLAMMDIGTISVTIPKSMAISLTNNRSISFSGCVAQVFCYVFCLSSDFFLLIIMALDRYVAICNPLQYGRVMHKGACLQMVATVWIIGLSYAILHTGGTFTNTFCSNVISQFFCEVPQLLKLSCSKIFLVEGGLLIISCMIALGGFIFIIITYVRIFAAVLRIPSVHGQRKALSTCLPHLVVVSVFIFTSLFAYGKPPSNTSSDLDLAFAVIYVIIPPILNPFIYSIRNKELKAALWKLLDLELFFKNQS